MKIRKKCCYNCEHWRGDRETTLKYAKSSGGKSFDVLDGWSPDGRCAQATEWMEVEVWGNATMEITINAAFCCNLFERRKSG